MAHESIETIKESLIQETGLTWPTKTSAYRTKGDDMAQCIDHTALKLETGKAHIQKLCDEAQRYSFFSVCVPLRFVFMARRLLGDSPVQVCTVIGFPFGYLPTKNKVEEARHACESGASELDMVICVGDLKGGDTSAVLEDIQSVRAACRGNCLKVILECSELSQNEIIQAAVVSMLAGADFVKTSTGFASGGARLEDIALLRDTVGAVGAVKASGGIRDLSYMRSCIAAGADRIGSSSGVSIVEQRAQA